MSSCSSRSAPRCFLSLLFFLFFLDFLLTRGFDPASIVLSAARSPIFLVRVFPPDKLVPAAVVVVPEIVFCPVLVFIFAAEVLVSDGIFEANFAVDDEAEEDVSCDFTGSLP